MRPSLLAANERRINTRRLLAAPYSTISGNVEHTLRTRLYLLFCLSGFVGVLAEQVFEKLLSVVVGVRQQAVAHVTEPRP